MDAVYPEGPYGTPILPAERPQSDEERLAEIREQDAILHPVTYTITAERLQSLLYAETMLDELSAAGVDNWEGYSEVDWDAIRAAEELPAELPRGVAGLDDEPPTVSPPAGYTTRAPGD